MVIRNWRHQTEPRTRRWTREEYYRMGEDGFFQDQRVELIDGEVVEMSPQMSRHAAVIGMVHRALQAAFGDGVWVRVQMPLALGGDSEPEPDLAVVRGSPEDYVDEHPTTAMLVVEVSETTLAYDMSKKANLYASAGLPEYWIVDLCESRLHVSRNPKTDESAQFGHTFATVTILQSNDLVAPLARPSAKIPVAAFLL